MKRYFEGLRFGLLLQIAIGPICLMVFNTAKNAGFLTAMIFIIAVALVDAFYIALASVGASKVLEKSKLKNIFKYVGALVLILFGINIVLNVYEINLIPGLNFAVNSKNIFTQGLILTLSNPMTIIFWGSVLTTKIIEDKFEKNELRIFSIGLVSSTLFFLTLVALLGRLLSSFIPNNISNIINIFVGFAVVCFGVKLLINKEK